MSLTHYSNSSVLSPMFYHESLFIQGGHVSHTEVYARIDGVLPLYPGAKIEEIQFVPLGVHLDSPGTENRYSHDIISATIFFLIELLKLHSHAESP